MSQHNAQDVVCLWVYRLAVNQFGDSDAHSAVYIMLAIFNHDHRTIIQITNTLSAILSFLNNMQGECFPRNIYRAYRIGEQVHIQHRNTLRFCHFTQWVIIGEQIGFHLNGECHQFVIYLWNIFNVIINDLHRGDIVALQFIELYQPTPSTIAP